MTYNPEIIRDILRTRSLSRSALAERIGINPDELDRELKRKPEPKQGILNSIAEELVFPSFIFFMKELPPHGELIPDFRSERPSPSPKSKSTTRSIQFATAIQMAAEELVDSGASDLPLLEQTSTKDIEAFALEARKIFDISLNDQLASTEARTFYNLCRSKIEKHGIFVLHDSFPEGDGSGFCLTHPKHPLIVVNTKMQTRGRRLFTLVHELAHVLMRKSGISDPFIRRNDIERICNRFAGNFLIPESFVSELLKGSIVPTEPTIDDIARLARRFKISQQATVLRLQQINLIAEGSYDRWVTAIHNIGNPDFTEKGGGSGGPPPQEKVKLAKYGFRFARAFDDALRRGAITEIDLFRATGLKPKYQLEYFDYANSITENKLQTLELDDG